MAIHPALDRYFRSRVPPVSIDPSTRLADVLDSLGFLDLFIHLEQTYGDGVSLDEVAACRTAGDLSVLLARSIPSPASRNLQDAGALRALGGR